MHCPDVGIVGRGIVDVPATTSRLGRRASELSLIPQPICPGIDKVPVRLLADRYYREYPVRYEHVRPLDISNTNIRQRRVDMDIRRSRSHETITSLLILIRLSLI